MAVRSIGPDMPPQIHQPPAATVINPITALARTAAGWTKEKLRVPRAAVNRSTPTAPARIKALKAICR